MSYELTAKILRHPLPGVSGVEKAVLASIADMIGDAGYCYPSYNHLSKRTGFARLTVIRAINQLYKIGLVSIEHEQCKRNKYRVLVPRLDKLIKQGKKILKTGNSKIPEGYQSDTSGGNLEIPEGYQKDTLIDKGKNNKKKIKNGATSSKIAKGSPKVPKGVGKKKEKNKNGDYGFDDFFDEMEKIENEDSGEKIYFAHDPADIEEVAALLATDKDGKVVLATEKGKLDIHLSESIPFAPPKPQPELMPENPNVGDFTIQEGVAWVFDGINWVAPTTEQKQEMKVADVLNLPIQKQAKKKTIKPTASMVWQWAVSEWYEEKKNKGKAINLTLTQKKKGQLNTAAKKINESGFEWRPLIEFTVKHWLDFTTFVTKATGKQNYPAVPDIDYFLFHVNHVIGFWQDKSDTKIKNKKPKIKVTKDKLTPKEFKKLTPVEKYNLEHGD